MITVVTPPVEYLLTTLATAQEEVADINPSFSADRLSRLLSRTSRMIASALTLFPLQTVTEITRQTNRGEIMLTVRPLREITALATPYITFTLDQFEADNASGILHPVPGGVTGSAWDYGYGWDSDAVTMIDGYNPAFTGTYEPKPRQVTASYTGGWIMPGQDGRDLPDDIEGVAIELIRDAVADMSRNPTVKSDDSPGLGSITYFDAKRDSFQVPPILQDLIDRYAPVRL